MNNDLAVLVISCDKYSDLWVPFFTLFFKHWPNCSIPVYLGNNYLTFKSHNVKNIHVGEDRSWAENVKQMLDNINENYVILLLDDFFIVEDIDENYILELNKFIKSENIGCIKLSPNPPANKIEVQSLNIGKIKNTAPYVISTQPAMWEKSTLKDFLKDGYSPWDFEKKNSHDVNKGTMKINVYGTNRYIIHRINGVERGKYYTRTIKLLNAENIKVDYSKRGIINENSVKMRMRDCLFRLVYNIKNKIMG